jgi:hypothetical protein
MTVQTQLSVPGGVEGDGRPSFPLDALLTVMRENHCGGAYCSIHHTHSQVTPADCENPCAVT